MNPDPLAAIAQQNRRLQAVFNAVEQACRSCAWVTLGMIPRGGDVPEDEEALKGVLDYLVVRGLLEFDERARGAWRVRR